MRPLEVENMGANGHGERARKLPKDFVWGYATGTPTSDVSFPLPDRGEV
jgi:hypothetical protein